MRVQIMPLTSVCVNKMCINVLVHGPKAEYDDDDGKGM